MSATEQKKGTPNRIAARIADVKLPQWNPVAFVQLARVRLQIDDMIRLLEEIKLDDPAREASLIRDEAVEQLYIYLERFREPVGDDLPKDAIEEAAKRLQVYKEVVELLKNR